MTTKIKIPPPKIRVDRTQETNHPQVIDLREMHKASGTHTNKNTQITSYLQEAIEHIRAETTLTTDPKKKKTNPFRIRSIQKAIDTLSVHPEAITSGAEALQLPGIGKGIAQRITEILTTGKLDELNGINDQYVRLIKELTKIHGIGPVKAKNLIESHQITSLADLIAKYQAKEIQIGKNELTHAQVIGLKYAKDLAQKIPRAEVDKFKDILTATIHRVDPTLVVEICGSYRRGKAISGDIDVLVSKPNANTESPLGVIINALTDVGLLVDHLTCEGGTKYMGVAGLPRDICRLEAAQRGDQMAPKERTPPQGGERGVARLPEAIDQVARRIDIRFIPYGSWGPALLYFTGSGSFNQLFRAFALQRGYTVNEYAICPFAKGVKGAPISVTTERDIFDIVGVKFLTPNEREF